MDNNIILKSLTGRSSFYVINEFTIAPIINPNIQIKNKIISIKRTVEITEAVFGAFLLNKNSGKIIIVAINAIKN